MHKISLLFLLFCLSCTSIIADEGMWVPSLIGKNYEDMVAHGLKLSKQDLYDINHSSLKDAIVQFGGGCTAEMISSQGLLLTNHHCGFDAIATLSTVQKNYLDSGFWAYGKEQELPAAGVTVIFLDHITDVTDEVMNALSKNESAAKGKKKGNAVGKPDKTTALDSIIKKIEARENMGGKMVANVKEYFNGNQYLLLVYKKYTDVRLVGTPPRSLGKFGGDTDNWEWPRHTADFSMFRVYADANNEPSDYKATNVPYHPKKYLPLSIQGEKEGDFAMIMGYPGRTNRYDISDGVALAIATTNPSIVKIRDMRLKIMHDHMIANPEVALKLASTKARIANYWKYYIGQTEQLKRLHIVEQKKASEAKFQSWAASNGKEYVGVLNEYKNLYTGIAPVAKITVYNTECFRASNLARMAIAAEPLYKELCKTNPSQDSIKLWVTALTGARKGLLKDFDEQTDREVFAEMTKMFYQDIDKNQQPDIYTTVIANDGPLSEDKTYEKYAAYLFNNTFLIDSNKFNEFVKHPIKTAMDADPAVKYAISFLNNFHKYEPQIMAYNIRKKEVAKRYIRGLMAYNGNKMFYPDANSTMRITYGNVKSYEPQDAVHYNYFTTLDGLVAKYKPHDEEFDAPTQILDLYKAKDYGRYMDADSTLHTCFITNDDITGGNSGSPCINGNGELTGAAFDGNWEAMSGDIAFDKKYKRTIVCDIRYILFIVDKMGHASNLIEEMDIH